MRWFKHASDTLLQNLRALRPELAQAAQEIYNGWQPEGEDGDFEFGGGGICDAVANAMSSVIFSKIEDVEADEYGHDGDDHAALVIKRGDESYVVDIPAWVYETGGGYSWKKIPNVIIRPDDVFIGKL